MTINILYTVIVIINVLYSRKREKEKRNHHTFVYTIKENNQTNLDQVEKIDHKAPGIH